MAFFAITACDDDAGLNAVPVTVLVPEDSGAWHFCITPCANKFAEKNMQIAVSIVDSGKCFFICYFVSMKLYNKVDTNKDVFIRKNVGNSDA